MFDNGTKMRFEKMASAAVCNCALRIFHTLYLAHLWVWTSRWYSCPMEIHNKLKEKKLKKSEFYD